MMASLNSVKTVLHCNGGTASSKISAENSASARCRRKQAVPKRKKGKNFVNFFLNISR